MIFCLEDDNSIRDLMIYTLCASGFEAKGFENSIPFWTALEETIPQLVMLDIMLPDEDGISVLKKLRANPKTSKIPVIMATAKGTEYDKVVGLDLGADDYLAKPFGMMEMVARIRAVLRRANTNDNRNILKSGELQMNIAEHTVTVGTEEVILTLKEFELLKLFMENPGQVFTRDRLLEIVWDTDYTGETRTIDVHIGTLRMKLKSCGNLINTIRGVGYRMEQKI